MRQKWRGRRNVPQPGEPLDDLACGAGGGASRRSMAKLAAAAVAGAVVGTETLSTSAGAATLAAVRGKVSGPGVTNLTGCVVFLYETTGSSPPHMQKVSATGHYLIGSVPPGSWRAICIPGPGLPLAPITYKGKPGYQYSAGTIITITGAQTVYANFALPPAGALQVMAVNRAGGPVSGAYVWAAEAGVNVAAGTPKVTDTSGTVILTHVPMKSKVFLADPATNIAVWWDGAQSWATATIITLPAQGQGISISATLPEG
jgi:hypothetical protein